MTEGNNIKVSIKELFQSQAKITKYLIVIFKATIIMASVILIAGYILSWVNIPKQKPKTEEFRKEVYIEGSIKYQNTANITFLNESFYDEHIAKILKAQSLYNLNSLADRLSEQLISKIVVIPSSTILINKPKIEETIDLGLQQNQKIIDSLSRVLKMRTYLDYAETSLLENATQNINTLKSYKNNLSTNRIEYITDFPSSGTYFSYQIGEVSSVEFISPNKLVIKCKNSAPILSGSFLTKIGVSKSIINESELVKQSTALSQIIDRDKTKYKQNLLKEKERINKGISGQRKNFRNDFYVRWYSTLALLLNSLIFIFLLIRFWIIIRQRKLPRKSTDIIYYATNRTSKFFRLIALIIIALAICRIGIIFILYLITKQKLMPIPLISLPINKTFIFALLAPPITFVATILITWFFILNSEWIDFITNCYEVVFHKAHEKDITADNKQNE